MQVRQLRHRFSKKKIHAATNSHKLKANDGNPFKDKSVASPTASLTPGNLEAHDVATQGSVSSTAGGTGFLPEDVSDDGYTLASNDTNDTGCVVEASWKLNTDVVKKEIYTGVTEMI